MKIVPSGPIAGVTLTPGRWGPHGAWGGSVGEPSGCGAGGHGLAGRGDASRNVPKHRSVARGAPGTSVAYDTLVVAPNGVALTRNELSSDVTGSMRMTFQYT